MKTYMVYRLTDPEGKVYIGTTSLGSIQKRCDCGYQHNSSLKEAIKSYGLKNFKKEVLVDGLTKEEAAEEEKNQIAIHNSRDETLGYNISLGGFKTFEGLSHTDETKMRMSNAQSGKTASDEARKNMSSAQKKYFETHRNHNFGKPMPEEVKQKDRASHRSEMKRIQQLDLDGKYIKTFEGIGLTAQELHVTKQALVSCLSGRSKTCAGYRWRYEEGGDGIA